MGANFSKMSSIFVEGYDKFSLRKILSILIVILFITTIFSPVSFAKSEKNNLIKNLISKLDKNILDTSTKASEKYDDNQPGGFLQKISDFIKNRKTDKKEILPLHVVTKYNGIEKVTKMKFLMATTIDVDNDGDKDVRVRVIRLPSIDLHPPALAMKTILIVHRLPGMNNIKNDLFEIYLEYYPRIITKFFYLTQNIDLVRIGYQSPAGGEVPKTFILTDKTAPHLLYPKLKTSHKISINPGSSTGKYQLNLILSFIDLQNYSSYSQGYAELKIMVNYSPAVKIKDITFVRSKDKFIGREQTIEITRDMEPSNVSFYYNQFIDYFSENLTDENKSSMFTVGNIPKKIEVRFLLAKSGYIEINTNNENMGYFKAIINNAILFGFDPVTETHIRIAWENRTLKSFFMFNLSIDVSNSVELKGFYFILNNFSQNSYDSSTIKNTSLQITASRLLLNLKTGGEINGYTTISFLFPILLGILSATSIDWHTENLQINAYDLAFDVKYTQNVSGLYSEGFTYKKSHSHFYTKYLDLSRGASSLSIDLFTGSLLYSGEGNINIEDFDSFTKDFYFAPDGENMTFQTDFETSFSSLSIYLSSSADILSGDATKISVSGNGFLKITDLFYRNSNNKIIQADFIQLFGNFLLDIQSKNTENNAISMVNVTGDGYLKMKNLYIFTRWSSYYYEYYTVFSFSYLNLSSNPSNIMRSTLGFDSSRNENLSIAIYNGFLEITSLYYRVYDMNSTLIIAQADLIKLSRNFSVNFKSLSLIEDNFSLIINSSGDGYLEINNLYTYSSNTYSGYDFYEEELSFSYLNISSLPSGITYSLISFNSDIYKNVTVFIKNGILNIMDLYYETRNLGLTTRKTQIDLIRLSSNFLFDIDSNNTLFKISATGEGNLEIKNLNDYRKYDYYGYNTDFSFSKLNISSYPSRVIYSYLEFNSSIRENFSVFINDGLLMITDLYYRAYDSNSTHEVAQVDLINVSKNLFINIKIDNSAYSPSLSLSSDGDGSLELRNILIDEDVIHHEIDFINRFGDISFSLFFPSGENVQRQNIYNFNHLDGVIEISGVRSSNPYLDALDNLYIDGSGDLKIETWMDANTSEPHIYLESQNGLMLNLFSIELDNGINYHIERQGTMEGYIGPGFMHIGADLNGDGDGFVFIDSSEIDFEDVLFTYKSSIFNKGFRFTPNIQSFDADSFLLQWDSFTLNNQDHTVIPYNWYKTGSISASFNIELIDGDNYYQLWPLDDLGGDNQDLNMSEDSYNEGMQPLEVGPPKPQKPVGPHGGIIIGRIVQGNDYTFSTLNNDIDQFLSYKWDWGNGTYSGWSVYLPSGVGVTGTHSWDQLGIYSIRVKAKNINGDESAWSDPLSITVRIKLSDDEQNNDQNNYVEQNQNNNQGQTLIHKNKSVSNNY